MSSPQTSNDALDLVFWPGSLALLGRSFEDQMTAAVAGGFTSIAISMDTFKRTAAEGCSARDVVDMAAERGLKINQLDGVTSWTPHRFPAELPVELRDRFDYDPQETLDVASRLGISIVITMAVCGKGELTPSEFTAMFADYCELAHKHQVRVDLEAASPWGLDTMPMAWDVLRNSGAENAGLLIDTWHLQKGSPDFEGDLRLLKSIPARYLQNVQLSDSLLQPKAPTLFEDCMRFRTFPREGEQSLACIVQIIADKGELKSVGPEVFSDRIASLSLQETGERAGRGTRKTLREVGITG